LKLNHSKNFHIVFTDNHSLKWLSYSTIYHISLESKPHQEFSLCIFLMSKIRLKTDVATSMMIGNSSITNIITQHTLHQFQSMHIYLPCRNNSSFATTAHKWHDSLLNFFRKYCHHPCKRDIARIWRISCSFMLLHRNTYTLYSRAFHISNISEPFHYFIFFT